MRTQLDLFDNREHKDQRSQNKAASRTTGEDSQPAINPQQDPIGAFLAQQQKPATRRAYDSDLRDYFRGDPTVDELASFLNLDADEMNQRLIRYQEHLRARGKDYRTINRRLSTIRSFLEFTHEHGLSQSDGRHVMRGATIIRPPLTAELDKEFLHRLAAAPNASTLRGKRDRCILALLSIYALTRSQICALNVNDYSVANASLQLPGQVLQERPVPGQVSSPHLVHLQLKPETVAALNDYLKHAGHGGNGKNPLFRNVDRRRLGQAGTPKGGTLEDQRLTVDGIYHIIRQYGRKLDVRSLNSRELRRSAIATALEAHHGSVQQTRDFLRHFNEDTLHRYKQDFQKKKRPS